MIAFLVICIVVFVLCLSVLIRMISDIGSIEEGGVSIAISFILLIALMCICFATYSLGQNKGRMEVITGEIKYKLVTNPDSTRIWKMIEQETK